jgi:protein-S-isoprenylcysteine O-methyltransferase Ste14
MPKSQYSVSEGGTMKKPVQPPVCFMALLILILLSYFAPLKIIPSPYNYLGTILITSGMALNLWTDNLFKKAETNVKYHAKPGKLVVSGPFKISRNPMYLGMLLILLGTCILVQSVVSLISPVVFVLIIEKKFIPVEEKNMQESFGKKYSDYKKKVRRWI